MLECSGSCEEITELMGCWVSASWFWIRLDDAFIGGLLVVIVEADSGDCAGECSVLVCMDFEGPTEPTF